MHVESSHSEDKTSEIDLDDWDVRFLEVNDGMLFDLIKASNYLNVESLLDLATQKVGDMMRWKTPEEIRMMFNIKDEFDPKAFDDDFEDYLLKYLRFSQYCFIHPFMLCLDILEFGFGFGFKLNPLFG